MNKFSLLALILCLALGQACKPDNPTDAGATTTSGTKPTTRIASEDGSFATPVLPNRNNDRVQLLLRTFWVAEHWVNHEDNSQNQSNKGRWWKFNEDGTFTTGQWQETYSHGSWAVYNDGPKQLLHLDAANDQLDMEFEMQAVSQMKDYMSWAGTGTYEMKRIAVKAISLLTMPTKLQFNVAE